MEGIINQITSQWVGMIFGVIVSAIFGFIFWFIARKKRQLVFAVNPVSTRVVIADQDTKLQVSYSDKPLGNVNITAIQIAVWNAGKETIDKGDIRGSIPVLIITDKAKKPVQILEATVRNQLPSDVINFNLEPHDSWNKGEVSLSWNALERNEGASIQLLYLGTPDVDINPGGRIRESGLIKRKTVRSDLKSYSEYKKTRRAQKWWLLISFVVFLLTFILNTISKGDLDGLVLVFGISAISLVLALISFLTSMGAQFPPFEF